MPASDTICIVSFSAITHFHMNRAFEFSIFSTDFFTSGDPESSDSETDTTSKPPKGQLSQQLPNPLAGDTKSALPSPFSDAGASVFGENSRFTISQN